MSNDISTNGKTLMAKSVEVVINKFTDEDTLQQIGHILRSNESLASQVRDFTESYKNDQIPKGLKFEPVPGKLLICHFGLGFQRPEIIKTRPVLVISPKYHEKRGLCTVVPISSKEPRQERPYHLKLPNGLVPSNKYENAWLKGDLVQTVGLHRLDRFKVGYRQYRDPIVPSHILHAARRCVLHATGMSSLTQHW